ncbi:MAG: NADH-quinone oxidoreductase subunit J [Candidatus Caenarcaniphilales bacterium]|nr:NADH-quinone oxidoreductase subunit J [Candidatus Caenarcaniphilales bacterium]
MEFLESLSSIPFYVLSVITVLCSLGMILNPNLVRAGFTLIGAFASISGFYFLLSANFVAVSQVLIYAVGIVLVIVFAVMLCSLKDEASKLQEYVFASRSKTVFALVISALTFSLLSFVIQSQDWETITKLTGATKYASVIDMVDEKYTSQIGYLMLNKYLLPFELISILLLVVLVGVIILSKKNISK